MDNMSHMVGSNTALPLLCFAEKIELFHKYVVYEIRRQNVFMYNRHIDTTDYRSKIPWNVFKETPLYFMI